MDPERPIEKMLRDCAKKRREEAGAPIELHPANRRRLQAEVARLTPKPHPQGRWFSFPGGFRPRLAWALCILTIAAVGATLLLPSLNHRARRTQLALLTATPAHSPAPAPSDMPATRNLPAAGDIKVAKEKASDAGVQAMRQIETRFSERLENAAAKDHVAPAQNAAPASPTAASGGGGAGGFIAHTAVTNADAKLADNREGSLATTEALAPLRSAPAPPREDVAAATGTAGATESPAYGFFSNVAAADKVVAVQHPSQNGAAATPISNLQRYVQVTPPPNRGASGAVNGAFSADTSAVLASFQMEQNGNMIRIVDGDGSIYSGSLQPATQTLFKLSRDAQETETDQKKSPQQTSWDGTQAPFCYLFQVSGTNRSLKQCVTFEGNVFATSSLPRSQTGSNAMAEKGSAPRALMNRFRLPLENSRISGTAVINNLETKQINAVPATH